LRRVPTQPLPFFGRNGPLCASYSHQNREKRAICASYSHQNREKRRLSSPRFAQRTGRRRGSLRLVVPLRTGRSQGVPRVVCVHHGVYLRVYHRVYTGLYAFLCTTRCILGYMPPYVLPGYHGRVVGCTLLYTQGGRVYPVVYPRWYIPRCTSLCT